MAYGSMNKLKILTRKSKFLSVFVDALSCLQNREPTFWPQKDQEEKEAGPLCPYTARLETAGTLFNRPLIPRATVPIFLHGAQTK
jgi:hypothetical protein